MGRGKKVRRLHHEDHAKEIKNFKKGGVSPLDSK